MPAGCALRFGSRRGDAGAPHRTRWWGRSWFATAGVLRLAIMHAWFLSDPPDGQTQGVRGQKGYAPAPAFSEHPYRGDHNGSFKFLEPMRVLFHYQKEEKPKKTAKSKAALEAKEEKAAVKAEASSGETTKAAGKEEAAKEETAAVEKAPAAKAEEAKKAAAEEPVAEETSEEEPKKAAAEEEVPAETKDTSEDEGEADEEKKDA